jgi:thiamine-monophosphate kinase
LLDRPQPRVKLGQLLSGHATACIDISDGLLADLGHILEASACGARVDLDQLPLPANLAGLEPELRWNYQLSGGDDYELLFTLPPGQEAMLTSWSKQLDTRLTIIGEIQSEEGIRCIRQDGVSYDPQCTGYEHFGQNT